MRRRFWIFLFGLLFLIALSSFLLCQYYVFATVHKTRERLMLIAANSALSISADEILNIPLEQRSEGNPAYLVVYQKLLKIKETNPPIKYAYIMMTTLQPGILQYVVDADPVPQIITAKCPTSLPGDKYDARKSPEMMNAYYMPTADRKITFDEWGTFISGYAPIRDPSGKAIAILGLDSDAAPIQAIQKGARVAGQAVLVTAFMFFIFLIVLP
jgi:hypothetical protein